VFIINSYSVGGKNASLGEMISSFSSAGIQVPGGFATTAHAYRDHLVTSGLKDRIEAALAQLDVSDVKQLAEVGATIREWLVNAPLTGDLEDAIEAAYLKLGNSAEGHLPLPRISPMHLLLASRKLFSMCEE